MPSHAVRTERRTTLIERHVASSFLVDAASSTLSEASLAGQLLSHAQPGVHPGQQPPPHAAHGAGSRCQQPGERSVSYYSLFNVVPFFLVFIFLMEATLGRRCIFLSLLSLAFYATALKHLSLPQESETVHNLVLVYGANPFIIISPITEAFVSDG